jgi:hypothetical protein
MHHLVLFYSKKNHYLYSNRYTGYITLILSVFLLMVVIIVTVASCIHNAALAQSNFTSSAPPPSGSTLRKIPAPRLPNVEQPPAPPAAPNNQPPAPPAAPPITAPPRPTIIAPSNFTASAITSEIEGGNTTTTGSPTNGSMFLGTPSRS